MPNVFVALGEIGRRVSRRALSPRTYWTTAELFNDACLVRVLGLRDFKKLKAMLNASRIGEPPEELQLPNLRYPLHIRPGTADAIEVGHTVVRQCYGQHSLASPIRFIIDAGANIGDSTCWFLSKYPEAHVLAIEPDSSNFEMLVRNTKPYGSRVTCLKAGLWVSDAPLEVCDGESSISLFVKEANNAASADCQGLCPQTLLKRFGLKSIDIFKIDIEGAETRLFTDDHSEWLPQCRLLFIDVHSAAAELAVTAAADQHGFRHDKYRELVVLRKLIAS